MLNKLAIGTAQFGLDYGISNSQGKSPQSEINSILDIAASRNIKTLDTAIAYGHSELSIGSAPVVHKGEFQIITKIANTSKQPITYLNESLKKLNVDSVYGLLAHDFELVFENPDYYNKMLLLKQNGKVSKIGVSVYTPTQLEYLIDNNIEFDILQFPYSILDQRFTPYFNELSKLKVETHIRSVFLQGLLFMNDKEIQPFFNEVLPALSKIREIAKSIKVPISALALNFALLNQGIEKVIVGCNNNVQLNENLATLEYIPQVKKVYSQLSALGIEDENILLPYNWKL